MGNYVRYCVRCHEYFKTTSKKAKICNICSRIHNPVRVNQTFKHQIMLNNIRRDIIDIKKAGAMVFK